MMHLANQWYIAAAARELGARPIRREVEGETLVLFRDEAGRARAIADRCVHRGMALSRGEVVAGCIRCPYHGWRYDGQGHVTEVPALADGEDLPRARGMRAYHVAEQDEQLWVWIGQGPPVDGPFSFPHHGEPGWGSFFMQTRFAARVEDCLENFLDVPHTLFVHPGLFRGKQTRPTAVTVRSGSDSVEAEFLAEAPLEGWGPRLMFPRGTLMTHTDRFLLPAISRVDYGFGDAHRFIITSQCTQRAEYDVQVTTFITWRLPLPVWVAAPFLRRYCRRVIRQDVELLAVQGEQNRRFGQAHLHTQADLLGRHIVRLRREASEGVTRAGPPVEELLLKV